MTMLSTRDGSATSGCSRWSFRARSIQACAWYSAECSFVYESRIARFASPRLGKRHVVRGVRPVEQPGDHAVLALVDRGGARLAAQRAVDRLDRHLAGEGGGVRLPAGDLALAGLPGGGRGVQRLADRLEDRLGREAQQRADAGGGRRAEVCDVVDLVAVQADRPREVDLDLVAGRDTSDQILTGQPVGARRVLGDGRDRRDVVAGMRVLGRQKRVVVVELADGDPVGPRRPLRRHAGRRPLAEDGRAVLRMLRRLGELRQLARWDRVRERLRPRRDDGPPGEGRCRHGRVVDDPVDHHLGDLRVHLDGVGRHLGDLPGELVLARQVLLAAVHTNVVELHVTNLPPLRSAHGSRPLPAGVRARVSGADRHPGSERALRHRPVAGAGPGRAGCSACWGTRSGCCHSSSPSHSASAPSWPSRSCCSP